MISPPLHQEWELWDVKEGMVPSEPCYRKQRSKRNAALVVVVEGCIQGPVNRQPTLPLHVKYMDWVTMLV